MAIYIHVKVLQIHIRINHKERKCVHICLETRLAFGRRQNCRCVVFKFITYCSIFVYKHIEETTNTTKIRGLIWGAWVVLLFYYVIHQVSGALNERSHIALVKSKNWNNNSHIRFSSDSICVWCLLENILKEKNKSSLWICKL